MALSTKARKAAIKLTSPFAKPNVKNFNITDVNMLTDNEVNAINKELSKGFNYYNYNHSVKDGKSWLVKYIQSINMDKATIKIVKSAPDWHVSMTIGSLAKMLFDGLPLLAEYQVKLDEAIQKIINNTGKIQVNVDDETQSNSVPIITIQERMKEKLNNFLGDFVECEIDNMFINKGKSLFKLSKILDSQDIPGKQANLIAGTYQFELDLITEALMVKRPDNEDELDNYMQLQEAYNYPKPILKQMQNFFQMLVDDASHHATKMKASRKKRVKKMPSVEKLVAKVKYKANDDVMKVVSIEPSKIIGAKELWLYNTKTRKIIKVIASEMDGDSLSIRGTTICDYNELKSMQKTLRKPVQQLADFQKAGKVKLRTFMEDIKAVGIKFNGRLNEHIIILKAIH